MKNQNVGRIELLQWINEFTECDYPRLELCCDAIGYCQVLDAIHPGLIPLQKLNFSARYTDEYSKNLKILDEAFNKLEIEKVVPIDKLSKGKFQDNMRFLQWLYAHASRAGPLSLKGYKGYEKRMEALSKQRNNNGMSPHLVPNKAFLKFKPKKFSQMNDFDEINGPTNNNLNINNNNLNNNMNTLSNNNLNIQNNTQFQSINNEINSIEERIDDNNDSNTKIGKKLYHLDEYLKDLEGDLKLKMEYNWKLMYAIEDMLYQRTTLYNILTQIEGLTQKHQGSEFKETIMNIITYTPNDFKQEEDLK